MRTITSFVFLFISVVVLGQDRLYVNANNGLIIRAEPSPKGQRIGKLDYGTAVQLLQKTSHELTIKDGQETISGNWVKVRDSDNYREGFVFDGYLTSEELSKRTKIVFEDFTLKMGFEAWCDGHDLNNVFKGDTIKFYLDLGQTAEDEELIVEQSKFKDVQLFQQHENSLTIMNDGSHCDLIEWEHYYSEWTALEFDSEENCFTSVRYPREAWKTFIEVDIKDLKDAVERFCGKHTVDYLGDINNVHQYPCGVSMSRMFYKIVLTNMDGSVLEKVISFEIPMGC